MSKKIYKVTGNSYTVWEAPDDEVVSRPFTEVTPPSNQDVLIIGFDWVENKWQTVTSVPISEYKTLVQGVANLGEIVSNLQLSLTALDECVKKLEKEGENNG
ncbi:hypothetical protein [Lactococcus petauri]|uniref:hypothetical protein n=1 Tax=Lactococcus petauri TaxID=1940789 RepID=UPI001F59D506|nr:hypothetical protein [Lactococcus petauri]